jgi:uncharacterized protein
MAEQRIRITAGSVSCVATLNANRTASAIWNALPIEGHANRWGDEIYFDIGIELDEDEGREVVEVGDVAFWPPGNAICIFWGPTPASEGREPRAASAVNVFGHIAHGATELASVKAGARVRLERMT